MIKRLLHRAALTLEAIVDTQFGQTGPGRYIDAYIGYTTPQEIILRGRVLSKLRRAAPRDGQSKLQNFKHFASMFLTNEVAGAHVTSGAVQATTDDEGYFELRRAYDGRTGWSAEPVHVMQSDTVENCPVFAPPTDAQFMVISDIDDTVLRTGAHSLFTNLYTSFTGNSLTRTVFKDAFNETRALNDNGRNPMYYVSSSPWNLHAFLAAVFKNTGLIAGPMFLRDLGISETKFITEGHGNHKGASIDTILAANPDLTAILLGDTGQRDARIYHDVIQRHPGRIAYVGLRNAADGLDTNDEDDLNALRATGVPFQAKPRFDGLAERVNALFATA